MDLKNMFKSGLIKSTNQRMIDRIKEAGASPEQNAERRGEKPKPKPKPKPKNPPNTGLREN